MLLSYSLNSDNNNADAYLSADFLSSSTYSYRNGQEIAVDTDNGDITAVMAVPGIQQ